MKLITRFQERVQPWMVATFGVKVAGDRVERNHRFLEESLELVQACGATASEAHQLVDYVYNRPVGEKGQEVGGVMVTLAALCLAHGMDMDDEADIELTRIWKNVEKIRAKQAAKPKYSPLPEAPAPQGEPSDGLTSKQAWWAGFRAALNLPADMPRQEAVAHKAAIATQGPQGQPSAISADDIELLVASIDKPVPNIIDDCSGYPRDFYTTDDLERFATEAVNAALATQGKAAPELSDAPLEAIREAINALEWHHENSSAPTDEPRKRDARALRTLKSARDSLLSRRTVPAAPTIVEIADLTRWYCENHPEQEMGHDGCEGAGIPAIISAKVSVPAAPTAETCPHCSFPPELQSGCRICGGQPKSIPVFDPSATVSPALVALEAVDGDLSRATKKAAVMIDEWKLPIFMKHLDMGGYREHFTHQPGFTPGTLLLTVKYESVDHIRTVIQAANVECAKLRPA